MQRSRIKIIFAFVQHLFLRLQSAVNNIGNTRPHYYYWRKLCFPSHIFDLKNMIFPDIFKHLSYYYWWKQIHERVGTAWYAVSLSASVHTHINTPNQSVCGPTTTAVRGADVHLCQGYEIAPDATWLWVRVQELIISNNNELIQPLFWL